MLVKALVSRAVAPLVPGVEPEPEPEPEPPPELPPEEPAGSVGTDVPVALAKQDEAAELAALVPVGALALTVPFPPKLQA